MCGFYQVKDEIGNLFIEIIQNTQNLSIGISIFNGFLVSLDKI